MDPSNAELLDHQADLTAPLRRFVYRRIGLAHLSPVLDVGCGTGKISAELSERRLAVTGLDADPEAISRARAAYPQVKFVLHQAPPLPFATGTFGLAFCHFVLMWQADPAALLAEMARVVRPGGWIVAAAEPDWGGRLCHPEDKLTARMIAALQADGADPSAGRKLREHFDRAGLSGEIGVWPSLVGAPSGEATFAREWELYAAVLKGADASEELKRSRDSARRADAAGTRLVFLPLFYGLARQAGR